MKTENGRKTSSASDEGVRPLGSRNLNIQGEAFSDNKIKRKVVCVFGEWGENTDFVIEPATKSDKDYFWIQECEE
jgi:hypothetical protein